MSVLLSRTAKPRIYQPSRPQPKAPCCPTCGGLECLCRPRFFAGQLLTDEDLNRLDAYIVGKQRLHNRYLQGWGVVCGLEVSCHPCDGYVNVSAGYALSPCGDDIIVCQDDAVNICELLQACRQEPDDQCKPFRPYGTAGDCRDQDEEWILMICYDEQPSRGVMPLRTTSSCTSGGSCARCGCGGGQSSGSRNCGCGCHAAAGNKAKTAAKPSVSAA